MDSKNFLVSKGFYGGLVSAITGLYMMVHMDWRAASLEMILAAVVPFVGGILAIVGRFVAKGPLALGSGSKEGQAGKATPLLLLFLALAVLLGGCAAKNIASMSGPDAARSVAYELLQTYKDLHTSYLGTLPKLTSERQAVARRDVAPKLDQAKHAILAMSSAANAWSIAADEDAGLAESKFQALWAEAAKILGEARNLYSTLTKE